MMVPVVSALQVWLAEQRADAEEKKMAEFRKQIAEERQMQVSGRRNGMKT